MPLLRLTNGFDSLSDPALEVRAASILNAMTANASFPTPKPTLIDLQTAINDYKDALVIAQTGSNYDKELKNEKKQELVDLLHSLGYYVLFTANGNELIAMSSGFRIAKTKGSTVPLGQPENMELLDGRNPGELELRFKRPQGAKSYIFWYTPEPLASETVWASQPGTSSKAVFAGLQSGKRYWCKVMVVGAAGQQTTSMAVSRIVQ